jgi:hypothetical protein
MHDKLAKLKNDKYKNLIRRSKLKHLKHDKENFSE